MNWWLEYKSSKQGRYFTGSYEQAVKEAQSMCINDTTVVYVFDGGNRRTAEVTKAGARPTFPARQGSTCPD